MKICSVCLKNDFLCNACGKKITSGVVSKTDVEISRSLFRLGIDANFLRSYDEGDYVIVLSDRKSSGLLIGRSGRNAKRLGTMLGKNVRVIEQTDDEKDLVERIIGAQVIGINKVYAEKEFYKIRVEKRFRSRIEQYTPVVGKILGKNVKFVFE